MILVRNNPEWREIRLILGMVAKNIAAEGKARLLGLNSVKMDKELLPRQSPLTLL